MPLFFENVKCLERKSLIIGGLQVYDSGVKSMWSLLVELWHAASELWIIAKTGWAGTHMNSMGVSVEPNKPSAKYFDIFAVVSDQCC